MTNIGDNHLFEQKKRRRQNRRRLVQAHLDDWQREPHLRKVTFLLKLRFGALIL